MSGPITEAGLALLDHLRPADTGPWPQPDAVRDDYTLRIRAIERQAKQLGITEWLASDEAERLLATILHREDITGRAIHEDAFCMQVPSFGVGDCQACQGHAPAILAAILAAIRAARETQQ